jgi:membrane-bound lytic murein transglycosylase D
VPLEIKYLAVVESALNPKAVSRVGATGLWQFMFQTGKQYGLNINTYVDDRSDPLKASDAAALYMSNMYKIFGDWDLVLASYNSGPGNVSKAIRRSGGQQNFWNIRKHLPKETQGYVPAFLATMYIYEYHKEHGIVPNRAAIKHFATDTIMVKREISFKQISDLIDIPVSQLQLLNPAYKRDVIPYIVGENHYLRMPNDKVAIYTSNEDKIYAYVNHETSKRERSYESRYASKDNSNEATESQIVTKTKFYKIKRGDSLSEIANKFGVTLSELKKWNHIKGTYATRGKTLKIYSYDNVVVKPKEEKENAVAETKKEPVTEEVNPAVAETKYKEEQVVSFVNTTKKHKVRKGDNLSSIADKYNVSVSDLKKWNNLKKNTVASGKVLKIKTTERVVSKVKKEIKSDKKATDPKNEDVADKENSDSEVVEKKEYKTQEYVVLKGDNLSNIAKKHKVSAEDLKLWNNLTDDNIQLGSTIIVSRIEIVVAEKPNKKPKSAKKPKKVDEHYYVQKGDSLYKIAKKYPGVTISDIKKWNGISNENLKPGMKLKISG